MNTRGTVAAPIEVNADAVTAVCSLCGEDVRATDWTCRGCGSSLDAPHSVIQPRPHVVAGSVAHRGVGAGTH